MQIAVQAVEEDQQGNFIGAVKLYKQAADMIDACGGAQEKSAEYRERAKQLQPHAQQQQLRQMAHAASLAQQGAAFAGAAKDKVDQTPGGFR